MHHVHESPMVMLVPLLPLAVGALRSPATSSIPRFVGAADGIVLAASRCSSCRRTIPIEAAHAVPDWVQLWRRWSWRWPASSSPMSCMSRCRACRRGWRAPPGRLYLFLLNKWYFDELYDFLFVRPAKRLGRGLWKSGDGAIIDGLGPDGVAALTRRPRPARRPAADRLRLSLRLRHADRRRAAGHLVSVWRGTVRRT